MYNVAKYMYIAVIAVHFLMHLYVSKRKKGENNGPVVEGLLLKHHLALYVVTIPLLYEW